MGDSSSPFHGKQWVVNTTVEHVDSAVMLQLFPDIDTASAQRGTFVLVQDLNFKALTSKHIFNGENFSVDTEATAAFDREFFRSQFGEHMQKATRKSQRAKTTQMLEDALWEYHHTPADNHPVSGPSGRDMNDSSEEEDIHRLVTEFRATEEERRLEEARVQEAPVPRRRLGWKPSHDIPRRREGFHPLINRVTRESERQS